jgi:hypothetical protein
MVDLLNGTVDQESLAPKPTLSISSPISCRELGQRENRTQYSTFTMAPNQSEAEGASTMVEQELQLCLTLFADLIQGTFSTSFPKHPSVKTPSLLMDKLIEFG